MGRVMVVWCLGRRSDGTIVFDGWVVWRYRPDYDIEKGVMQLA